jgi:aryl-alcohol dehydrogenase-like predicted oxidoreductase
MADLLSTLAVIKDPTQDTRWQGHASAEATSEYASGSVHGFKKAHFRPFAFGHSEQPLMVSTLATGTFLGDADDKTDEAVENAVFRCVAEGWNVVDSAPVYREGRGEKAVGRALRALRLMGGCRRSSLFLSTKIGIAATKQVLSDFVDLYSGEEKPVVTKDDIYADEFAASCWHPCWLEASLNRSLDALQIDTIDVLYLHNPAEFLFPLISREEFWQKMDVAFEFCEKARKEGKIKAYGLATWDCFRVAPDDKLYVSLEQAVKLAEEVFAREGGGGDKGIDTIQCHHGFQAIMLPVNTGMREAFTEKWQTVENGKENVTLLEAAKKLGVAVFCSGPLAEGRLLEDEATLKELNACEELAGIDGAGPKLMQIARSVPGVLSIVIGHKTPINVEKNVALTKVPPLSETEFFKVMEKMSHVAPQKLD